MHFMACSPREQQGSMLLEALIAILIFSMGIIAIVGLQATSIKLSTDAKYRSEASLLANKLIGQMWVSDRASAVTLATNFSSSPAGGNYTTWLASSVQTTLPGVSAASNTLPTVSILTPAGATQGQVTINIFWQMPGETTRHNYTAIAQIK